MRYLGNKTKLLHFIDSVIEKHNIDGQIFADLFAGTCSVGDYYKDKYNIIANDYMSFSKIICEAKLLNSSCPKFAKFMEKFGVTPFEWLNSREYVPNENYFIYHNYTPLGNRMFFTEENAIKIDGMRFDIEDLYMSKEIAYNEYAFLIASLLESTLRVSNTSGTYQAFLKFWDKRALKTLILEPLNINNTETINNAVCFSENTNLLVRKIKGDIAYIDPPYTINQYTNSYHILETITKCDNPEIFGKTGRRTEREMSAYSNKQLAYFEFEDLFRQLDFTHVLVSYSNQSLLPLEDLVELARKFAIDNEVFVELYSYREYATNNLSYKDNGQGLKEAIIYFRKDNRVNKSPLNYSGSKDVVFPKIYKYMPKHIGTFVDAMGGAFNVGANVVALEKVIYNEYNPYIYGVMRYLITNPKDAVISDVKEIIKKFNLRKKAKDEYLRLREYYNQTDNSPAVLFTLQIYSFQNIIRFNSNMKFNTPVGNNEYCENIEKRIQSFIPKTSNFVLQLGKYEDINIDEYPVDTVFYFDPPYFITMAEYNDGKRGLEGWNANKECEMLSFLEKIDKSGRKFMLSNVLTHKGKEHRILKEWAISHNFHIHKIGETGIKYPRTEVLITNYADFKELL